MHIPGISYFNAADTFKYFYICIKTNICIDLRWRFDLLTSQNVREKKKKG